MTVAVNDTIERYVITGAGPYPYTWRIFNDTDLQVYALSPAVPPVPTLLTYLTHYTVAGANSASGGSITLTAAAIAAYTGYTLDIRANTPRNQPTSIRNQARFLPEIHEDAFDYLDRQIQDVGRLADAAVRAPDYELPLPMVLPPVATRAGKYQAFDASGLPTASSGTGNDSALRTDLASQVSGGNTLVSVLKHDAEANLGITVVRGHLPVGCVDRYGAANNPGSTDMLAAWNAACKLGRLSGHEVTYGDTWPYRVTGPINCTTAPADPIYGFAIRNTGHQLAVTFNSPSYPSIIADFNGGHVFDMAGSQGITLDKVTVGVPNGKAPVSCFFMARNTSGGGSMHKFFGCRVYGSFTDAVVANYGAEDDEYHGCNFFNYNTGAPARVFRFTSRNGRVWTSSFLGVGLAGGIQSCIAHMIYGGAFAMTNGNAAAAVFDLDDVSLMKVIGPHLIGAGCKAFIIIDTTNAAANSNLFAGVSTENVSPPQYGVYIGDAVRTVANLTFIECRFLHTTKMIKGNVNTSIINLQMLNLDDSGIGSGGVDIGGTVTSPQDSNVTGPITYGTLVTPNFRKLPIHVQSATDASLTLRDDSAGANAKGFRIRSTGGQFVITLLDDSNVGVSNALVYNRATGRFAWTGLFDRLTLQASTSYANDAAAAGGGVPIGGEYRNGSVVQIRIA